jgi:hypothetical protein
MEVLIGGGLADLGVDVVGGHVEAPAGAACVRFCGFLGTQRTVRQAGCGMALMQPQPGGQTNPAVFSHGMAIQYWVLMNIKNPNAAFRPESTHCAIPHTSWWPAVPP